MSARRIPALLRRGGRSPAPPGGGGGGGGVAPTITVAPVLTWTVAHGSSPTITEGTYTGDAGTWTYDLVRLPSTTVLSGVSKATVEAYVADRSTDLGPDWKVTGTITNGSGSDSADSNTVTWDRFNLPISGSAGSDGGFTLADSGTTVDSWASTFGAYAATLTAPTAARRFAYNATGGVGGRPIATSDGVSDTLLGTHTIGATRTTYEAGFVGRVLTASVGRAITYGTTTGATILLSSATTSNIRARFANGTLLTPSQAMTTLAHYSHEANGGTGAHAIRITGATVSSSPTGAGASQADGQSLMLGSQDAVGTYLHCEWHAWYSGEELTADQRLDLRALLTYLTGVAS